MLTAPSNRLNGPNDSMRTEIWAQLLLCAEDTRRIRDFFVEEIGIDASHITRRMHLTVYHALGPMLGVIALSEKVSVTLPAVDTRFMVMTAGGEVAQPDVEPREYKIGIRVLKRSLTMDAITDFRNRLIHNESEHVLGEHAASTRNRSAFGAPHFQPHMTVLEPGSSIPRDLTPIGARFRETIGDLTFDTFVIEIVERGSRLHGWQADLLRQWRGGKLT